MLHNWREDYKEYESGLAKTISDAINKCGSDHQANAEYFANFEHRYLQSELMNFFCKYVEEMAKNGKKGVYDGRNEWACLLAVELEKTISSFMLIK